MAPAVAVMDTQNTGSDTGREITEKSAPRAFALDTIAAMVVDVEASANPPDASTAASAPGDFGSTPKKKRYSGATSA